MTYKRFFFAYLKNPKDIKKIVPDSELTSIVDPAEFGWSAKKLKSLDGRLEGFVASAFIYRPVKLYCGTKPLALGAVVGAEMQGDRLKLKYEITEVYPI